MLGYSEKVLSNLSNFNLCYVSINFLSLFNQFWRSIVVIYNKKRKPLFTLTFLLILIFLDPISHVAIPRAPTNIFTIEFLPSEDKEFRTNDVNYPGLATLWVSVGTGFLKRMELLYLTRRAFLICREKMHLSLNVHTSQNITDAQWRLHVSQTEGLQLWEGMTLTTENKIGLTNGQTVTATISDTPNFRRRSTTRNSVLQRNCPGLHAVTG